MRKINRYAVLLFVPAVFIFGLFTGQAFCQVVLIGSRAIDTEKQWVFVSVTIDGQECKFTHVAPVGLSGTALQEYVSKHELAYKLDILRDMYPAAPDAAKVSFTEMEKWIAAGCKIGTDPKSTITAVKQPWTGSHPPEIVIKQALDSATTLDDLKAVLKSLLDK